MVRHKHQLPAQLTRSQRDAVNIGVIQPLSGANAQFGINSRNGIELVADGINAAGRLKALGGAKINLVVSDATSNPTTASTAAPNSTERIGDRRFTAQSHFWSYGLMV
jgi:ABC-type branched-subunit amino acid transport system substrate-binding protein